MENIKPKLILDRKLIMIGVATLCAGIIIGFKLAGGEKITLEETIPVVVIEPETSEVSEND
jgi:hypothetical protein